MRYNEHECIYLKNCTRSWTVHPASLQCRRSWPLPLFCSQRIRAVGTSPRNADAGLLQNWNISNFLFFQRVWKVSVQSLDSLFPDPMEIRWFRKAMSPQWLYLGEIWSWFTIYFPIRFAFLGIRHPRHRGSGWGTAGLKRKVGRKWKAQENISKLGSRLIFRREGKLSFDEFHAMLKSLKFHWEFCFVCGDSWLIHPPTPPHPTPRHQRSIKSVFQVTSTCLVDVVSRTWSSER